MMKIINGWQVPQAGDLYNTGWAGNIENILTSYTRTVEEATGKIVLSANQNYTDFYKVVNVGGVEYVVYDATNATMGVKNIAPLAADSDIGSATSAFDTAYIRDIYTLSAGQMVKVGDNLGGGTVITKGDLTASPSNVVIVSGGTNAVFSPGTVITFVKADSTNDGYLTSADYNRFNSKADTSALSSYATTASLSAYIPQSTSGTFATSGHTHPNASTTQTGFLTSADFTRFNNGVIAASAANILYPVSNTSTIGSSTSAFSVGHFNTIHFAPDGAPAWAEGNMYYDIVEHSLSVQSDSSACTMNVGQELWVRVFNRTGATIPNGSVVYISSASTSRPIITLAQANSEASSEGVIGMTTMDIPSGTGADGWGYVTTFGLLHDLNTQGMPIGSKIYLSPTVAGGFTTTEPIAPNHRIVLGYVVDAHPNAGIILVNTDIGSELGELHDVYINNATDGQIIQFSAAASRWQNVTPNYAATTSLSAYIPYSVSGTFATSASLANYATTASLSAYIPQSTSGTFALSASLANYIPQSTSGTFALSGHSHIAATSANNGFITSADWTSFNNATFFGTSAKMNHGWPIDANGNTYVNLSYTPSTRTVTVTPKAGNSTFDVWVKGNKFTMTSASLQHASTSAAAYFCYFTSAGTFESNSTVWNFSEVSPTAYVYYSQSITSGGLGRTLDGVLVNELHTWKRNNEWHKNAHLVYGTQTYGRNNFTLSNYTTTTDNDASKKFIVATGTVADEDIFITTSASTSGSYTIMYNTNASDFAWEKDLPLPALVPYGATSANATSGIYYVTSNGVKTHVAPINGTAQYVNYYLFVTTSQTSAFQYVLVPGQAVYTSLATAQAESYATLGLGEMPFQEIAPLYQITYVVKQSGGGGTNYPNSTGHFAIAATPVRIVGSRANITGAATSTVYATNVVVNPAINGAANVQSSLTNIDSGSLSILNNITSAGGVIINNGGSLLATNTMVVSGARVGVGTNAPDYTLSVIGNVAAQTKSSTGSCIVYAENDNGNHVIIRKFGSGGSAGSQMGLGTNVGAGYLRSSGGLFAMGTFDGYDTLISTNNTERMRITSAGVVSFGGTAYPTAAGTSGQILKTNGTTASWGNQVTLTKTLVIESPTSSENITFFRPKVAITVQEINAVITGSTSVSYQVKYSSTDRSAAGTTIATSVVSSTTTGTSATISNATVPANSWVWCTTSAVGGTPTSVAIDLRYTED